jgi:hypothetical protein
MLYWVTRKRCIHQVFTTNTSKQKNPVSITLTGLKWFIIPIGIVFL